MLRDADVLCAPSLGGESFGMVLTEAFAAGTPVVASDIAGYRDVVRDGVDGVLVPRGDATALAEALRDLCARAARGARAMGARRRRARAALRLAARRREVLDAYEDAIATPAPQGARAARRRARRASRPPTCSRACPRRGCRASSRAAAPARRPRVACARRAAMRALAALGASPASAARPSERIGVDRVGDACCDSSPAWVLVGLGADVRLDGRCARSPGTRSCGGAAGRACAVRDALQGTLIGVLMSATLPARLGEPARALIVARRDRAARASSCRSCSARSSRRRC